MLCCRYINPYTLGAIKVSWVLPLVKLVVDWWFSDLPGLMSPRVVSSDVMLVGGFVPQIHTLLMGV